MSKLDWERVQSLFDQVADLAEPQRASVLEQEHVELRAEVESLLASADHGEAMRRAIAVGIASLTSAGHVGQRVGAYRLIDLVGEGGMGVVYLGERVDGEYRGEVAIKILRSGYTATHVGARFRDERQFLAALDHPCIVSLLDAGTTEDALPYLVMEYVDGVPLTTFARDLTVRDRVELIARIARAVQYAHQKLIVHRDLKPSNILVTRDGMPKLLDFGIAKLLAPTGSLAREADTRTGISLLTIDYASPEQARGEAVSVATDVYSLGAVLYELLAGRPPQRGTGDVLETLRIICEVEPPRPSVVGNRREVAGDLDNIVARALQKRPADRYASAAAFADDLERYLNGMPVDARAATFWYRARKLVARRRAVFAVSTLAVTALATTTVLAVLQAQRADDEARRAERQNRSLLESQGWQELERGDPARALPYLIEALRREDTAATRYLIARAMAPLSRRLLTVDHRSDGLSRVMVSPDGSVLVAMGPRGARAYTDQGVPTGFALPGPHSYPGTITSNNKLVIPGDRGSVDVYDLATTKRLAHFVTPFPVIEAIDATPDGQQIVVLTILGEIATCGLGDGACRVQDFTTYALGAGAIALARRGGAIELRTPAWDVIDTIDLQRGDIAALHFASADRLVVKIADALLLVDLTTRAIIAEHRGQAGGVIVSPDGTQLATLGNDLSIRVWNVRTGQLVVVIAGLDRSIHSLVWSADSTRLATAGVDNRFRVWNVRTGTEVLAPGFATVAPSGRLGGSMGRALVAVFSRDGKRLVTASATELVWWDLERSSLLGGFDVRAALYSASYSPTDERLVAVAGLPGYVGLHDLASSTPKWQRAVGTKHIYDAQWSPDGTRFVVAGMDAVARVYRLDGTIDRDLVGHVGTVHRATFSPDGKSIVTAGVDRTLRVWNAATGEARATLASPDRVMAASWSRDGTILVAVPWNGSVTLSSATSLAPIATIHTGRSLLDPVAGPHAARDRSAWWRDRDLGGRERASPRVMRRPWRAGHDRRLVAGWRVARELGRRSDRSDLGSAHVPAPRLVLAPRRGHAGDVERGRRSVVGNRQLRPRRGPRCSPR